MTSLNTELPQLTSLEQTLSVLPEEKAEKLKAEIAAEDQKAQEFVTSLLGPQATPAESNPPTQDVPSQEATLVTPPLDTNPTIVDSYIKNISGQAPPSTPADEVFAANHTAFLKELKAQEDRAVVTPVAAEPSVPSKKPWYKFW